MKYLVWSYDYDHASAGQKVLHRLCHELNEAGQEAYIGNGYATNPEWNTPHYSGPLDDDWIAVYPEIVRGNPWNARRIARWVLNVPGLLGGDRVYAGDELVFSWDPVFLDGVPLLHLPAIELDIYTDRGLPREGEWAYVGKGSGETNGAPLITLDMRRDRYALADALNRATLLRCLDAVSGMVQVALLCGCPVLVVPTGQRIEPNGYRAEYEALWPVFRAQLAEFVRITQAVEVAA